tara:strand:- start:324 stop:479 length:156 start_codon:yes stop_codon:yes gene_type:complete
VKYAKALYLSNLLDPPEFYCHGIFESYHDFSAVFLYYDVNGCDYQGFLCIL